MFLGKRLRLNMPFPTVSRERVHYFYRSYLFQLQKAREKIIPINQLEYVSLINSEPPTKINEENKLITSGATTFNCRT